MKFSGAVEKIDEMGKVVGAKGKKETMTLTVGDRPKITKTGKEMPFAELKRNMEVGVDDMKEADYNSKGQERPSLFKKNAKKTLLKKMLDISPTIKYVFVDDKTQTWSNGVLQKTGRWSGPY